VLELDEEAIESNLKAKGRPEWGEYSSACEGERRTENL
jgi:hypothetical protein